jgi:hypothetical protein
MVFCHICHKRNLELRQEAHNIGTDYNENLVNWDTEAPDFDQLFVDKKKIMKNYNNDILSFLRINKSNLDVYCSVSY